MTIGIPMPAKKRSIAFRSPRASRSPSWCTQAQRTDGTSGAARISMQRSPARDAGATTQTYPTRKSLDKVLRISSSFLAPLCPRLVNRRRSNGPARRLAPDPKVRFWPRGAFRECPLFSSATFDSGRKAVIAGPLEWPRCCLRKPFSCSLDCYHRQNSAPLLDEDRRRRPLPGIGSVPMSCYREVHC